MKKTKKLLRWLAAIISIIFAGIPLINICTALGQIPQRSKLILVGHRGAGGLAPENTVAAISKGIAEKADWVEIDIRQTKDNRLIVMHDEKVDRTTTGHGRVQDLTFAEIKSFSVKYGDSLAAPTVRVPLLTEVMARVSNSNARLIIEIKNPDDYPGMVSRLIDILKAQADIKHFTVFSFDISSVMQVKKSVPGITTGIFSLGIESVSKYKDINCDYISPIWNSLLFRPNFVSKVHNLGKKMLVWTPDSKWEMKYALKKGVDGIITNRPDRFNEIYNEDQGK